MLEQLESRILMSAIMDSPILPGDVSHDGYVNSTDAYPISRIAVHLDPPNATGDLNGDGKVNGYDASLALTSTATIYDNHQVMSDNTLNVWIREPADMGNFWTVPATVNSLYGPAGTPQLSAIHQGTIPDCYLLAGIGVMVLTHPNDLVSRMHLDGTGFAYEFTTDAGGSRGPRVVVHASTRLSVGLQINNGLGVYWEELEKMYTWFRGYEATGTPVGTFASIGWGSPGPAYYAVAGQTWGTDYTGGASETAFTSYVSQELSLGYAVGFQTSTSTTTFPPSHVLLILSVNASNGTAVVWNPWGFTQTVTVQSIMLDDINQLVIMQ